MLAVNEELRRQLADLKARQGAGEHLSCPRCGRNTMKANVYANALSRQADIMVCDACGMEEALRAFGHSPLPLSEWACFHIGNGVRDETADR